MTLSFNDRVYGFVEVDEPVLEDIIQCNALKRLKKINQHGPASFIFPQLDVSRFEHSLGVMILLKKLSASLEEQIAGLLHDVGHTAFSHVVDMLLKNFSQDYHEKIQHEFIKGEIAEILEQHGFEPRRFVLKENNFPLLKRPLPDLCADRLDYFFRDWVGFYKKKDVLKYLKNLMNIENKIVFNDISLARAFSFDVMKIDRELWGLCPINLAVYKLFSDMLKSAIEKNIINIEELKSSVDEEIMKKLESCKDKQIEQTLKKLNPGFKAVLNEENFDFCVNVFSRAMDPNILYNNEINKLSKVDETFRKFMDEYMKKSKRKYAIKIL